MSMRAQWNIGAWDRQPSTRQHGPVPPSEPLGAELPAGFGYCRCRRCPIGNCRRIVVSASPSPAGRELTQGQRGPDELCRCFRQYWIMAVRPSNRKIVGCRALPRDTRFRQEDPRHAGHIPGGSAPRRSSHSPGHAKIRRRAVRRNGYSYCPTEWRTALGANSSPCICRRAGGAQSAQRDVRGCYRAKDGGIRGRIAASGSRAFDASHRSWRAFGRDCPRSQPAAHRDFVECGQAALHLLAPETPNYTEVAARWRTSCRRITAPETSFSGYAAYSRRARANLIRRSQ